MVGKSRCQPLDSPWLQCLAVAGDWAATGGQGDKKIFVYRVDSRGRLTRLHTCCGHTGWVRRIAILHTTMLSGSSDMTIRVRIGPCVMAE